MPVPWKSIDEDEDGPLPSIVVPDVKSRSMTLSQLYELRDYLKRLCKAGILKHDDGTSNNTNSDTRISWFDLNQYHIDELVIKKIIKNNRSCSWMELVAEGEQQPDTFISHYWGDSFRDFMLSIKHHATHIRARPDHAYWFCVCANNQWKVEEEIGHTTLKNSPFHSALGESQETLLMLDRNGEVLFRSWCLYEWHQTIEENNTLSIATRMGMVGSELVSSDPYIEMVKGTDGKDDGIQSHKAVASDPRDQRRIQNAIAGCDDEAQGLEMIVRIKYAEDGEIITASDHSFHNGDAVVFRKGIGKPLVLIEDDEILCSKKIYYVKVVTPTVLKLFQSPDLTIPMRVRGGDCANIVAKDYEDKCDKWLDENINSFSKLDECIKGKMSETRDRVDFTYCHPRGDLLHPHNRAVTLAQLRKFFQMTRNRYKREKWDTDKFHKCKKLCDEGKGANQIPGSYIEDKTDFEWENLTWYDIKYFIIMKDTRKDRCSYMESVSKQPLRVQYHFNFPWDMNFSKFMAGIELLAEARQMTDTTPLLLFPLAFNLHTDQYYNDNDEYWEGINGACESSVYSGDFFRTNPLRDLSEAISLRKSTDLMCSTGILALIRPFEAGSWEFGKFNIKMAQKFVDFEVRRDVSDTGYQFEKIDHSVIEQIIRLAGAGPLLRNCAYYDDDKNIKHVLKQCQMLSMQSPQLKGPLGETPQHIAASAGSVKALKFLLNNGVDINAIDFDGETPLHFAALSGKDESVQLLLNYKADHLKKSFLWETPIEVARQKPAFFIVNYEGVLSLLSRIEETYYNISFEDAVLNPLLNLCN